MAQAIAGTELLALPELLEQGLWEVCNDVVLGRGDIIALKIFVDLPVVHAQHTRLMLSWCLHVGLHWNHPPKAANLAPARKVYEQKSHMNDNASTLAAA